MAGPALQEIGLIVARVAVHAAVGALASNRDSTNTGKPCLSARLKALHTSVSFEYAPQSTADISVLVERASQSTANMCVL